MRLGRSIYQKSGTMSYNAKHELNISRRKTEYMSTSNTDDIVKLGEEEMPSINAFKYRGSIFAAERGTEGDFENIVRQSCNKCR